MLKGKKGEGNARNKPKYQMIQFMKNKIVINKNIAFSVANFIFLPNMAIFPFWEKIISFEIVCPKRY